MQYNYTRRKIFLSLALGLVLFANHFSNAFASDEADYINRNIVKITTFVNGGKYATGAGIIFAIKDNRIWIITACHVVINSQKDKKFEKADKITVEFYDKKSEFNGKLEKFEEANDLAVISVEINKQVFTELRSALLQLQKCTICLENVNDIRVGDEVRAIGHPWATWKPAKGTISMMDGDSIVVDGGSIIRGYSGGPLLNKRDKLIGIVLSLIKPSSAKAMAIDHVFAQLKLWNLHSDLQENCYYLKIDSKPGNASVYIDNKPRGTTPLTISVKKGDLILALTSIGFPVWREAIFINNDTLIFVDLTDPKPTREFFVGGFCHGFAYNSKIWAERYPVLPFSVQSNKRPLTAGVSFGIWYNKLLGAEVNAIWLPTQDQLTQKDGITYELSMTGYALSGRGEVTVLLPVAIASFKKFYLDLGLGYTWQNYEIGGSHNLSKSVTARKQVGDTIAAIGLRVQRRRVIFSGGFDLLFNDGNYLRAGIGYGFSSNTRGLE
jgi:S1-C subfamily serine protease